MGTRTLSDAEKAILGDAAAAQLEAGVSDETTTQETAQGTAETTPSAEGQEAQAEVMAETQAPVVETLGTEPPAGEEQVQQPAPEAPAAPEVPNAAPAVVAQSSAPAKPEVKAAPQPAAKKTDVPTGGEMNAISRRVMSILNTYAEQMAPRRPVSDAKIIEQQRLLFEALTKAINESGEDFEKLMKMVFAFFEEHRAGVFHETRVFRGMDNIPLSANDRSALQRLINMFKLLANPQSRKLNLKQVDLHATLQYGITEVGRNRVLSFFNK